MNLFLSDSRFDVGGQSYEGFPILINDAGAVVEVALHFFVDELIGRAGARDQKTWEAYGRHLYDYFGYLEAKGLSWDHLPGAMSGDVSPLAHYVRWCDQTVGNTPSYINDKVGLIRRFYIWALRTGLVDVLPFQDVEVVSLKSKGILSHTSPRGSTRRSTDMYLRESEEPMVVLSRNQIDSTLRIATNPTHRAMVHLGLNAGLRAEEIVTFPSKYVADCSKLSNKVKSVSVYLNPREMATKNDRPRVIRVSVPCMNLLWQYREAVRPALENATPSKNPNLFLTRFGKPFVADGLVAPLARMSEGLGFHLHPHMLRHTFATHTLAALEDLKRAGKLRGSPIVILQGLMGHASITTTSRYLHFLDSIDDAYGTQYQVEIDSLVLGYLNEQKST